MSNIVNKPTNVLHITGDMKTAKHIEASLVSESGGFDHYLTWQDALYEGPIDAEIDLAQLSQLRADYFVDIEWAARNEIDTRYQVRNDKLLAYADYHEVILWFDHDLNSQLQLVQVIHWFAQQEMETTVLSLVSVDRLSGINAHLALNLLGEKAIQALEENRWEVTVGQMNVCERAWRAFGAANPNVLLRFYGTDTSVMPHLKNTILRYLKQFPALVNGLSHSEFLILNALRQESHDMSDLYVSMQSKEAAPFMNQAIFRAYVRQMSDATKPLIKKENAEDDADEAIEQDGVDDVSVEQKTVFNISDLGRQVLHSWVDWVQINGINRRLGGVELTDGCLWRYDQAKRKLLQTYV